MKHIAHRRLKPTATGMTAPATAGMTTVELLVVLGIIGIILSVSIPLLARLGLFSSQNAELAARELYMMLRAAKVYASTYNVEAAVAYAGDFRTDSLSNTDVPVIDAYAVVRKVRREDLETAEFQSLRFLQVPDNVFDNIFVPVRTEEGTFTPMEAGMCILPDVFEVRFADGRLLPARGLDGIHIWNSTGSYFETTLADYDAGTNGSNPAPYFPAHRFLPSGEISQEGGSRQRAKLRVGLSPDAVIEDRFYVAPQDALQELLPIQFSGPDTLYGRYLNPEETDEAEVDVEITLYLATGRVKID